MTHKLDRTLYPSALVSATRWCPWRRLPDGRKFPLIEKNRAWRSFAWAEAEAKRTRASGLGLQLGDGLVGVDLDHCRDPHTGMVIPEAGAIVAQFAGAYVSPSVSGRGVHVLGAGPASMTGVEVIFREAQAPQVILHDTSWWLTMLPGDFGDPTRDVAAPLLALRARSPKASAKVPAGTMNSGGRGFPRAKDLDDDELLSAILESGQGVLFAFLFRGEWPALGKYTSQSEADLALVTILSWWTDRDRDRVDRLFRQSGLMRPKWERPDYRERAFAKAGC